MHRRFGDSTMKFSAGGSVFGKTVTTVKKCDRGIQAVKAGVFSTPVRGG